MSDRFRKTIRVDEQAAEEPGRRRGEPLIGFIDRDANTDADGRDLTRPVSFHPRWGFLYAPRGITSRWPWGKS
jgi:hypothetical protein